MIHHHDEVNKVQLQTYFITFIIFSNIKGKGDMTIIYNSFAIDKLRFSDYGINLSGNMKQLKIN